MKKRMLRTVTALGALALALSACVADPNPAPGWVEVGDAFRGSPLADVDGMGDEEATDAVIAAELGDDFGELDGLVSDGYFSRYDPDSAQVVHDAHVDHHQFSLSIDGYGRFIAARAFVALGHSVTVVVTCDGADVNAAAQEVLSKNVIVIEAASQL